MTKKEKLLDKAKNSPQNLTFDEFKKLLIENGWSLKHISGSHHIFVNPANSVLVNIQNNSGKVKKYQVKQFLDEMENAQKKK